jgi:uncharacterized protein (TIGR02246 family)
MTTTTPTATPTAVLAVLDRAYAAWAAGDADTFVADYRQDATVVMPGVFRDGRAAVRDAMAAGFAGPLRGSRVLDEPISVRVAGDTAIVISRSQVVLADGQQAPEVHATWVLTRQHDGWRVAAYANAPVR